MIFNPCLVHRWYLRSDIEDRWWSDYEL
uniref:Uncharacterized protein n=1 Tax=Nelumbo nucifera TaxID=4432 RepID=A0A822YE27_NELNU|nr:TPA_asm: hypothetical protein HUJ06_030693 [Nelumbo nucifera]